MNRLLVYYGRPFFGCLLLPFLLEATRFAFGAEQDFLEEYAATRGYSLGKPKAINITPDGDAVLFLRSGPRSFSQDLYEFDVSTGVERRLASAEQLSGGVEELSVEERARRERMRISARGVASFDLSHDGRKVLVPLGESLYVVDRQSREVRELPSETTPPIDARFSPDGQLVAAVRDGELEVQEIDTGKTRRLTTGASDTVTNGLAEFVAQEEMGRMRGYWWSPDSQMLAYQQTDVRAVETLYIADPSRPDRPATAWRYPRPGTANAQVTLGLVSASGGPTTWVDWDRQSYPYLARVVWAEDAPLTILVQDRKQQEQLLLKVDSSTGETTTLLTETDAAWINIDESMPHWLPGGESFLWTTERTGRWRLERLDRSGKFIEAITPASFPYQGLAGVTPTGDAVIVNACENPTESHLYRIGLEPERGPPTKITQGEGRRWAKYSRSSDVHVRGGSSLAGDEAITVYGADGAIAGQLESVAAEPPFQPDVELVTVGTPPLHAAIVRPRDFEKSDGKPMPVIVSVYGGPHAQTVQAAGRRYLLQQWMADQGFIVVSIDGRGTPGRGRAWERAIRGDLIAAPLDDQVRGLQALGDRFPEMDLSRVGIYGWSFGGYFSAMAVMQRPDVFHVGIAGAPVSDWRDYDTHYTERYMGLPEENADGYESASVLTYAKDLRRPLLVIHGTADDNVYFLHSMKLMDALFASGKQCDFLPLTGETHMVTAPDKTRRLYERMLEFLKENLTRR